MQAKHVKSPRWVFVSAALVALLGIHAGAEAALIHINNLPSNPSFDKNTNAFLYLEGESADRDTSDTFADSRDQTHTFFRNDANPSDSWSAGTSYNNAKFGIRGGDTSSFTNVNAYWEDEQTGLPAGSYDVFVRAFPSTGGTQTFTFYAGDDRTSVDAAGAVPAGTVATGTQYAGTERWYKIGSIDLTAGMDTFRLRTDTNSSTVRFDTVLLTGGLVPEPSTGLLALADGAAVLTLRRRREVRPQV
jgi:hypothetical protein